MLLIRIGTSPGHDKLVCAGLDESPRREIGAFEAKNKLGQLLDSVQVREEIVMTPRGKPVAV